jgi:predicted RNA-binding Zn-ribbon protein involved in translation (DUF1610 family)
VDRQGLSGTQRFFTRFLGREAAAAAEAESRAWLMKCPNCGFQRSVWETGGVRYKASGGSSRVMMKCPSCGQTGWHRIEKGPNFPTASGPAWPLVRLILGMMFFIFLLVAAILLLVFKLTGLI